MSIALIVSPEKPGNTGMAFKLEDDADYKPEPRLHGADGAVRLRHETMMELCNAGKAKFIGSWFKCEDCGRAVLEATNERISIVRIEDTARGTKQAILTGYICGPRYKGLKNPNGSNAQPTKKSCHELRKQRQFEALFGARTPAPAANESQPEQVGKVVDMFKRGDT